MQGLRYWACYQVKREIEMTPYRHDWRREMHKKRNSGIRFPCGPKTLMFYVPLTFIAVHWNSVSLLKHHSPIGLEKHLVSKRLYVVSAPTWQQALEVVNVDWIIILTTWKSRSWYRQIFPCGRRIWGRVYEEEEWKSYFGLVFSTLFLEANSRRIYMGEITGTKWRKWPTQTV